VPVVWRPTPSTIENASPASSTGHTWTRSLPHRCVQLATPRKWRALELGNAPTATPSSWNWTVMSGTIVRGTYQAAETFGYKLIVYYAVRDGKYLCEEHRFPPCIGCGRPRPEGRKKLRIVDWRCEDCRSKDDVQCCKCLQFKSRQEFDLRKESTKRTCRACLHPPCHRCGTPVVEVWRQGEDVMPYCSKECRLPPCSNGTCEQRRPYRLWFHLCPEWQCQGCKDAKKQ
jgi:hypothetical protein